MVGIGALEVRGGPVGNGEQFVDARPALALLDLLMPRPRRLGDDAGHMRARGARIACASR